MPVLSFALRVAVMTLSASQLLQLLPRLFARSAWVGRAERGWVAAFTALVGLRAALEPWAAGRQAAGFLLLWAGGGLLTASCAPPLLARWHLAAGGLGAALLALGGLGFAGTAPFRALSIFACALALLHPLRLLLRLWRSARAAGFLLLAAAALLGLAAAALPWRSVELGACLLLLAGAGWLSAAGGSPLAARAAAASCPPDPQERRLTSIRHRLIQTEHTLQLQERLAASGLLTAGAAHELKSILNVIAVTAEHGLSAKDGLQAPASLRAVARHAEVGRRAVAELLDELLRHGPAEPEPVRLRQDLEALLRLVRASYRPEGIRIESDLPADLTVLCRRGELEQVLLNLIRNAAESLRRAQAVPGGLTAGRTVRLTACRLEGGAALEVLDDGPGVPAHLAERIFEESWSAEGSSGLGLYLSRLLVQRGGGRLECLPRPEGGRFRLILPVP